MKISFITLCLIFVTATAPAQETDSGSMDFIWTKREATVHAERFNSPREWNEETLHWEIETLQEHPSPDYPLHSSPFPTPVYTTTGNGVKGSEFHILDRKIIGQSAFVNRGSHSEFLFRDEISTGAVYFTILSIDDGVQNPNPVEASSRNHPHYFAQGSINSTSKSKVDWVAIQTADQNAYAIVNGRIFDLKVGRVILAAPQTDGSVRFYQTTEQPLTLEELDPYLNKLIKDQKVIEFFTGKGNI